MIWRFYRPENVSSVGVFVSHWSNGGIKLSNAVKHKESGTTEADGSQEQPAGLQQQSNNNNLKRFSLICEHFLSLLLRLWRPNPKDVGIPVRLERWLDCFTQFFYHLSPSAFNMQIVGMQSSDAFI